MFAKRKTALLHHNMRPVAEVTRTLHALLAVCGHLQDEALYQPSWKEACNADGHKLRASCAIEPGQLLTMFPVHALGCEHVTVVGRSESTAHRLSVPLLDEANYPYAPFACRRDDLFIEATHTSRVPGWLGHLAEQSSRSRPNCLMVPVGGAAPLMALVATRRIRSGSVLLRPAYSTDKAVAKAATATLRRYRDEISELRGYLGMALGAAAVASTPAEPAPSAPVVESPPSGRFHDVNRRYPGLTVLRESPDPHVGMVRQFLSAEECERLISKARPHMQPCVVKNPRTGAVELDPDRMSSAAAVPLKEVPSIAAKLVALANCEAAQLETLQVLRYTEGQFFLPHTDGFSGPTSACGFEDSGRLVTIFAYLNDVPSGGETRFPQLGLTIAPERGAAILHFPETTDFEQDRRTEHEGATAVDDKWLLATWVWAHGRTDEAYFEDRLPSLSADII